jgi:hypothetical protein
MKNKDKILATHSFATDGGVNSGETIEIFTTFLANGDKITEKEGWYVHQEIILNSYCNRAIFELGTGYFTPENLRKLANELERARNSFIKA